MKLGDKITTDSPSLYNLFADFFASVYDSSLYASIKRVMYNPIALTQMFSMGLVSASMWGYGYYEIDIIKYFGAIFSDPILKKFCQIKAFKQATSMSVLICKPQWEEFKPVCAVDDMVSYVSPCQAGCRESQEINGIQVYSNCTCAGGGRVLERACGDEPCRNANSLHDLMFYMLFMLGILTLQGQGVLLLKIVDPRDKSVAQGLAFSFVAILTFVVGHTIFYGLQITTCRWFEGNKCHLQSASFPYLIGHFCAFLMLTSIMIALTSWHFFKKLKEDDNEVNETRL
ncbi:solute carrier organic anion transporter family member 1A1-like [Melitaea cinxia]|uniref:solute carrier organic anion transporter family member 1A1-like n=1 Tax=Melitaea cinxia TaxID=113334 RepID=UPI001E273B25|nr:solute carrier organic anion transporter family member 1A1-like [Melitaea cinxia]